MADKHSAHYAVWVKMDFVFTVSVEATNFVEAAEKAKTQVIKKNGIQDKAITLLNSDVHDTTVEITGVFLQEE